jgi:1,2-diacylglycerol 3-beta-galactosyltransferase
MNSPIPDQPHVVIYFADTGGGHRSAGEAIAEALHLEFGRAVTTEMVNVFKDHSPHPLRDVPDLYPRMVKAPRLWEASFYATDGRARVRVITASVWPYVRHSVRKMVRSHPADLIVTVHPFANTFALKALGKSRPPFYTVVTDIVTTHALWFDKRADLIFVPSEGARQRGLAYHMPPEKLDVAGFPVMDRYCAPAGNQRLLRRKLGWPLDKPIALLVGGGEGMGPLARTAYAIDESGLDLGLVVVAGRNQRLKAVLEAHPWENPAFIYGFTHEMPDFMRAADFLVTKAGAASIMEGLNASLPIILYAKVPGQEDGNVTFVVDVGAGIWAPAPQLVVRALTRWISRPKERLQIVENCRQAARPDAARRIARLLGQRLGLAANKEIRLEAEV